MYFRRKRYSAFAIIIQNFATFFFFLNLKDEGAWIMLKVFEDTLKYFQKRNVHFLGRYQRLIVGEILGFFIRISVIKSSPTFPNFSRIFQYLKPEKRWLAMCLRKTPTFDKTYLQQITSRLYFVGNHRFELSLGPVFEKANSLAVGKHQFWIRFQFRLSPASCPILER